MLNKYYLIIKTICYSYCIVKDSHVFNNHLIFVSYRAQCMYCTMKSGEAIYVCPKWFFQNKCIGFDFPTDPPTNDLFTDCVGAVSEGVMIVNSLSSWVLTVLYLNCPVEQWLLPLPVKPSLFPHDVERFYWIDWQECKHFYFYCLSGLIKDIALNGIFPFAFFSHSNEVGSQQTW